MNRLTSSLLVAMLIASPIFASANIDDQRDRAERDKERKEARADRESDLYDEGTDALDDNDYSRAARIFREVAKMQMEHADAALYWLARSQNELGQRADALSTLVELQKAYPKSHWSEDSKALEVEIRQKSGAPVDPKQVSDDDVKLMVLNGLMGSDPERAVPVLEKVITGTSSRRVKERAIFVLSQSNSQEATNILGRIARDSSQPDLQAAALRYLGIMGGENSRKVLADVYSVSRDVKIKKNILKSYMISGSVERMSEIARTEKNPELRAAAIRNLGLMGGARSSDVLVQIYETDANREVKEAVIKSLFLQSNGKAMVALARKEKDPELKKELISKMALIRSDEVSQYLLEILKD